MTDMTPPTARDPLTLLPAELILRVLEFCPTSSLASLTRLNRAWNGFIDETHQKAIYSSPGRTKRQPKSFSEDNGASVENTSPTFSRYFEGVSSSKDLCRRETLLRKNWDSQRPVTRETVIRVGTSPIWRFRPDFTRRFVLSTTQNESGLNVTDMYTGVLLWREENVRPFAHLEYCERGGTAVWDDGDVLEVWRVKDGGKRGEYERVKVLRPEVMGRQVQVRGFQLRSFGDDGGTLCVVSNDGVGFVYGGVCAGDVELVRTIEIETGAVGHLDQGEDVVVYSMGNEGFHFYDKATGRMLGVLDPGDMEVEEGEREVFHIKHPAQLPKCRMKSGSVARQSGGPSRRHTVPLTIERGPFNSGDEAYTPLEHRIPQLYSDERFTLDEDEWGAGMLCGQLFVGVSREGRVLICPNWRKFLELKAAGKMDEKAIQLIECDMRGMDETHFDLGGWLSVQKDRIMFEAQYCVYVVGLTDEGRVVEAAASTRPSYALLAGSLDFPEPMSFMGLYEDCLMSTYTILTTLQQTLLDGDDELMGQQFRTCAVRVVSFAPDLERSEEVDDGDEDEEEVEEEEEEEVRLEDFQGMEPTPEELAEWLAGMEAEKAAIEAQNARGSFANPNQEGPTDPND